MATKNFTQFNLNTQLTDNDFLVGYYSDDSEEFKLNLNTLRDFLEPTITVATTTEFTITNSATLTTATELNLTIPANSKYAITGQLLLKEVGSIAPGVDYRVIGGTDIYGNHSRYDTVDLPVGIVIPTDISVSIRSKILQLDATGYNFFSLPVSFVIVNNSSNNLTIQQQFAQSQQTADGSLILGIGSYLIGHPINGN